MKQKNRNSILVTAILTLVMIFNHSMMMAQKSPAISYLKNISAVADSVIISTVYSFNKEDEIPFFEDSTMVQSLDTTYIIKSAKLTDNEIKAFNSKLTRFKGEIALPNHYDIEIKYYIKDSLYTSVVISSMTRDISIINNMDCEPNDDIWEYYHNSICIFRDTMSKDLEKYLTTLLRKKKLWKESETFFEW